MSIKVNARNTTTTTTGTPCRLEAFRCAGAAATPACTTRRVVMAGGFKLGAKVADQFRQLGWEVHTVTSEHDVHAAAAETDPHAILLLEDAGDESGYLACAKLRHTQPELKVVVVGRKWTPERERFAEFVGGTFATEDDMAALVNAAF